MLYGFLKIYVGFILRFFAKWVQVNGKSNIPKDSAVIYAEFHPNSFMDAMVLDVLADRPIWSLARGDAFKRDWVRNILFKLHMMPIYRISEGKENLGKNDETFEKCSAVFKQKGQVQIFSEGICKNQTELLPLKKGTARLVLQSWSEGIDLTVIPTAINYSHYRGVGKRMVVNYGKPIKASDFENVELTGASVMQFNNVLTDGMKKVVSRDFDTKKTGSLLYYFMYFLNFPLYFVLGKIIAAKTRGTVFYDSVFLALLVVALPLYWALLAVLISYLV